MIWKSESTSSRKASNSSSARSISSIRSTTGSSVSIASSSGRRIRNSGPKSSSSRDGSLLRGADVEQLARVVPLVDGVRDVEALVALQADQPRARSRSRATSRPRSCRRRPRPRAAAASRARARGRAPSRARGRAGSPPPAAPPRARRSSGRRSSPERSRRRGATADLAARTLGGLLEHVVRERDRAVDEAERDEHAPGTRPGRRCSLSLPSTIRSAMNVSGSKAMPACSSVRPSANASRASACSAVVSECPSAISRSWSSTQRLCLFMIETHPHPH